MSADLTTWLGAPDDFAAGVALYAQLGTSSTYKQLFALGETGYSRGVLRRELQALADVALEPTPAAAANPVPAPAAPPVATAPTPPPTDAPALLQVRQQLKAARDERSQLHAQLTAPRLRKADRCTMVHRIADLTDLVQELQHQEAHVLEHGRLPGPVSTADLVDREQLVHRRNNLRSQRSRLRKKPDRAADLQVVEAELALIETKLNPSQS
ncbi:hypothetical protein [Hymenobacter sp. B81]|uniref:hypothetical protein n=1 Tax=Hymenobacter sp. B81 TaxID=3344878 RepID=UPI0037DD9B1B